MSEIRKRNINKYKKYGLNNVYEKIYTCVICQKSTSIEESFSDAGKNLICNSCRKERFKSTDEMFKWIYTHKEGEADE